MESISVIKQNICKYLRKIIIWKSREKRWIYRYGLWIVHVKTEMLKYRRHVLGHIVRMSTNKSTQSKHGSMTHTYRIDIGVSQLFPVGRSDSFAQSYPWFTLEFLLNTRTNISDYYISTVFEHYCIYQISLMPYTSLNTFNISNLWIIHIYTLKYYDTVEKIQSTTQRI